MKNYKEKLKTHILCNLKAGGNMFSNLGVVREVISDTELKVYNSVEKREVIVKASKDYITSIKLELKDEDHEPMIVEYDLKTKIINENIE